MADELITAVRELTGVVKRLEMTLEDYPKRAEVERRFTSKREAYKNRKQFLALTVTFGLVALMFSYFASTSTVSYCFLSPEARAGNPPDICSAIPGFDEAEAEQKRIRKQFEGLLKLPEMNEKRLTRIENELGLP